MGLQDRDYLARPQSHGLSVTLWLIIICCVVFVGQFIFSSSGAGVGWPVYLADIAEAPSQKMTGVRVEGPYTDGAGNPANVRVVGNTALRQLVNDQGEVVGKRAFVVQDLLSAFGHFSTYAGVLRLEVWRLITFQFLHGSPLHLFFNMLGLWSFGRIVEEQLGGKRFLAFYLICGIAGGLMYLLLNLLGYGVFAITGKALPGLLVQHVSTALIGASAGVFGVIMAAAKIAPRDDFNLFGLISMPLKHFAYGYVALSLLFLLVGTKNAGGEAAHVGGAIAGFFFIRNSHLLRDFFDIFGRAGDRVKAARGPKLKLTNDPEAHIKRGKTAPQSTAASKAQMPAELRAAMDAALAKQLSSGAESLTAEDLESLRKATEWLQKGK